jgi:hypothetical protein
MTIVFGSLLTLGNKAHCRYLRARRTQRQDDRGANMTHVFLCYSTPAAKCDRQDVRFLDESSSLSHLTVIDIHWMITNRTMTPAM